MIARGYGLSGVIATGHMGRGVLIFVDFIGASQTMKLTSERPILNRNSWVLHFSLDTSVNPLLSLSNFLLSLTMEVAK